MCESTRSGDCLLRDTVELDTLLQPIPSVDNGVRTGGAKPGQTRREQVVLTLQVTDHSIKELLIRRWAR